MTAKTIFSLEGVVLAPPDLAKATLILIDYQNEYLAGPLALVEPESAVARAARLLAAARAAGSHIIHVAQLGEAGGIFDRASVRGAFIDAVSPVEGEKVVEKVNANAFFETGLQALVGPAGTDVIIAGFMTHNCVSSTVRAACDLGYAITIVADACATRDLPLPDGTIVAAAMLHRATIAALGDAQGLIVDVADLIGA
ncbi:isochorismatase family protein [Pararhizobium antarcticum]|uniref:Isochorismatase n=1 Tax=Pararhizobium antarcticum TaxID=1798805 RepID=A0A657LP74_9HYPH|nr:isochorismatase family protein [Pararhizobium antarcticum]OJF93902.1 isochorismatase [Pararhizobium antarcticum]OJF99265.1 isochorismatase [Rhizobium sp. 58]